MKFGKKIIALAVVGGVTVGVSVNATQKVETVQRTYQNIQVQIDGEKEVPNNEPFMIDGSVYIGLRDASQLLGAQVHWDGSTNTVQINSTDANGSEIEALKQEVANKNLELMTAQSTIAQLEEKIAQYEMVNDNNATDEEANEQESTLDFGNLEDLLNEEFEHVRNVAWSFELSGDKEEVVLRIVFDSEEDEAAFNSISKSALENFVEDVSDELQKQVESVYDLPYIPIVGEIYDVEEREVIVEFEMDNYGRLDFDYVKVSEFEERDLEHAIRELENEFEYFPEGMSMNGYDFSSVRIRSIKLIPDGDEIIFEVHTNMDDYVKSFWNRLKDNQVGALEEMLEEMEQIVDDYLDVDSVGYICDRAGNRVAEYDGSIDLWDMK